MELNKTELSSHLWLGISRGILHTDLQTKIVYKFVPYLIIPTCPIHPMYSILLPK